MIQPQGKDFLVMCDEDGCTEQFVSETPSVIAADKEAKSLGWKELSDGFHVCPDCDESWSEIEAGKTDEGNRT